MNRAIQEVATALPKAASKPQPPLPKNPAPKQKAKAKAKAKAAVVEPEKRKAGEVIPHPEDVPPSKKSKPAEQSADSNVLEIKQLLEEATNRWITEAKILNDPRTEEIKTLKTEIIAVNKRLAEVNASVVALNRKTPEQNAQLQYLTVVLPCLKELKSRYAYAGHKPTPKELNVFLNSQLPPEVKEDITAFLILRKKVTLYWNKVRQYHALKTEAVIAELLQDSLITPKSTQGNIVKAVIKYLTEQRCGAVICSNEVASLQKEIKARCSTSKLLVFSKIKPKTSKEVRAPADNENVEQLEDDNEAAVDNVEEDNVNEEEEMEEDE